MQLIHFFFSALCSISCNFSSVKETSHQIGAEHNAMDSLWFCNFAVMSRSVHSKQKHNAPDQHRYYSNLGRKVKTQNSDFKTLTFRSLYLPSLIILLPNSLGFRSGEHEMIFLFLPFPILTKKQMLWSNYIFLCLWWFIKCTPSKPFTFSLKSVPLSLRRHRSNVAWPSSFLLSS